MAVIPLGESLVRRQTCYGYGYDCYYYSPWNSYGRWIVLAVVIVGAFLLFLLFSCITARRRRRAHQRPYPMTGWAAPSGPPPPYQGGQQGGYQQGGYQQGGYQQGPPQQGGYYGPGQQSGVTQPGQTYDPSRGAEGQQFQPPAGPPPGK